MQSGKNQYNIQLFSPGKPSHLAIAKPGFKTPLKSVHLPLIAGTFRTLQDGHDHPPPSLY